MQAIFQLFSLFFFAYFSTFELYVVYTGNIIDISAQQSSIRPKIDEVHFFFSRLQRQPTNRPPVRHSDPGTPLCLISKNFTAHFSFLPSSAPKPDVYVGRGVVQHASSSRFPLTSHSPSSVDASPLNRGMQDPYFVGKGLSRAQELEETRTGLRG